MNDSTEFHESQNDSADVNFDELQYLSMHLGPQRQPMKTLVPLTIVYVVMSITGIFGNLSVCCVILRIPSMRSATNYYLFSLAVSDLLILLLGMEWMVVSSPYLPSGLESRTRCNWYFFFQGCPMIFMCIGSSIPGFLVWASVRYEHLYPKCKQTAFFLYLQRLITGYSFSGPPTLQFWRSWLFLWKGL